MSSDRFEARDASNAVVAPFDDEVTRLRREVEELHEYQSATAAVLSVISRSPSELQPVLEAIVETAQRLSRSDRAFFMLRRAGLFHLVVDRGAPPELVARLRSDPVRDGDRASISGRVAAERRTIHIPDIDSDPDFSYAGRPHRARAFLGVPLLRSRDVIGVIIVSRNEPDPFAARQIALVETFASQAVIAIENARLFEAEQARTKELAESLDYQTAMAEVLQVISGSPSNVQPVFDKVAESAARLFETPDVGIFRRDGDEMWLVTNRGSIPSPNIGDRRALMHTSAVGRAVLEARTQHVYDTLAVEAEFPETTKQARIRGYRTLLAVPLVLEGRAIGLIVLRRLDARRFADRQVGLLETFADQAVIAIENARLFQAEQTRTKELTQSLEYQTAISDVLSVISRSPGAVQPVLDTIVETSARLARADFNIIFISDADGLYRPAAAKGANPDWLDYARKNPPPKVRGVLVGRTVLEARTVHIHDCLADPEYDLTGYQKLAGFRTMLGIPLLKQRTPIGVIGLSRAEVEPFSDAEIGLVETFADQAVIAIENARLFEAVQARSKELTESLEYQTATSEVLDVISRSPSELMPVMQAICDTAARMCSASSVSIHLREDEGFRQRVLYGLSEEYARLDAAHRHLPERGTLVGRVALTGKTQHIVDLLADPEYQLKHEARIGGIRTVLGVPLIRFGEVVGVIALARPQVQPFEAKQIEIVTTFASQAVIAISNTRLFEEVQARTEELTEALANQTATGEILSVISHTPTDSKPVFDAISKSVRRLTNSANSSVFAYDGKLIHLVAFDGHGETGAEALKLSFPQRPGRTGATSRAIETGVTQYIPDVLADPDYAVAEVARAANYRSIVSVPMLRDGRPVGAITASSSRVAAFTDKNIALLKTFADQAVIAMNNARLFDEVQARTKDLTESLEYQTATSEVLGVISRSKFDLEPVLNSVVETAVRLCRAHQAMIYLLKDGFYRYAAGYGKFDPRYIEIERNEAIPAGGGTLVGRVAMTSVAVRIEDAMADAAYAKKDDAVIGRIRSMLGVPLLRDGAVIGVIGLARNHVEPFEAREIDLVTTFANQAVIAIENARLFEAEQTRTKELTESLEQQTATTEVLKVISRSTFDLEPVLQSVLETATRLCQSDVGQIFQLQDGVYRWRVGYGLEPAYQDIEKQARIAPTDETIVGRAALAGQAVQVLDPQADPTYGPKGDAEVGNIRTMLGVPLMRFGRPIGVIALARQRVEAFTPKQIELLTAFADQAVIAIENTRLLQEIQDRSAELSRTVSDLKALTEVGQVVSSTLDQKAVLSTVVERATVLAQADAGVVFRFSERDRKLDLVETIGFDSDMAEAYRIAGTETERSGVREAIAQRRPVHIPDIAARPPSPLRDLSVSRGYHASLIVPLIAADRTLGTLTILRKRKGEFAPGVIAMMLSFANQSAIALHNARLFDEIETKSREIEIASQHKSQFLANMSHELRTPLNAILGYTELLVDGTYGALSEKPKSVLERVERNGRHLLGLINDVLDLSKIEAGEMTLGLEEYSWGSLVRNVVAATEPLARQKGLVLESDIAEGLPRGSGDARRLNQVLLNLVGNAIKFTDHGSVRIAARADAGNFEISVTDTGPGIAPEDQIKVFEKFQQIDNSSTRKKGGSGLGLSISRELVELHGGEITVSSVLGQGSTFRIVLPCRWEPPPEATA